MVPLPQPLRLRASTAADQPFLDALYRSTRDDLAAMPVDESFRAQLVSMQQQAQVQGLRRTFPQAQYFLLEREAEAIGRLVVDAAGNHMHLVELAIAPAARRAGAGSAVLRALQTLAAQRDQALTLSVGMANPLARRLYARLGFVVTAVDALQEQMRWQA